MGLGLFLCNVCIRFNGWSFEAKPQGGCFCIEMKEKPWFHSGVLFRRTLGAKKRTVSLSRYEPFNPEFLFIYLSYYVAANFVDHFLVGVLWA